MGVIRYYLTQMKGQTRARGSVAQTRDDDFFRNAVQSIGSVSAIVGNSSRVKHEGTFEVGREQKARGQETNSRESVHAFVYGIGEVFCKIQCVKRHSFG